MVTKIRDLDNCIWNIGGAVKNIGYDGQKEESQKQIRAYSGLP